MNDAVPSHRLLLDHYLDDVLNHPPSYIINTQNPLALWAFPLETPAIRQRVVDIQAHLRVETHIGKWTIYAWVP